MINAAKLLADLQRLRNVLDADLRTTHAVGAQREAVQAEWREAFDLGRTRDTFEAFLDGAFDQAVVHWILGCVFLRFLEDNLLVDRPFLSGAGERLDLAKERQAAHFRARPHDSDTEYLLTTFAEGARLPGLSGLYDPAHNPLFRLPLSGDAAMALIRFFREVLPETGELAHDFTDPDWGTRFLGDLYQDLSEEARKRYALLQTPEFVEAWILDRTLEPAIREFGHERATMIDPACGSGHFLSAGSSDCCASGGDLLRGCRLPSKHSEPWMRPQAWTSTRSLSRSRGFVCWWPHCGRRTCGSSRQPRASVYILLLGTVCCTGDISSGVSSVGVRKVFAACCAITSPQRTRPRSIEFSVDNTTLLLVIRLTSRRKIRR
jgi:hypothetical protein